MTRTLLSLASTVALTGGLVGASMNAINGLISPDYFRAVMGWRSVDAVWRSSIAQGAFEGLVYGALFAVIFTSVVGFIGGARCSYARAARPLLHVAVVIYASWALGGLASVALALVGPEFFGRTFRGVPSELSAMIRYAWVGGSIWGAMFGGLLGLSIGSATFAARWRSDERSGRLPEAPAAE